jgi:RNA polymerase sigma-70 factor (ECF subfamily)
VTKSEFTERILEAEPTLYHISRSILRNDCDCADAVQEALLKAYCSLPKLREPQYFKTWVCRILIRECYKIANSRKRLVPLEEAANYEAVCENRDIGLYDAIMRLSSKHRLAVTLHYVEGFSIAEVAKMLKIPQGTVKSRLSKARAELKAELEPEEKSGEKEICNEKRIPRYS